MSDRFVFYKDKSGEWRWRRRASNGKIVGASCDGYETRRDCIANAIRNGYELQPPKAKDMGKQPMYPIDSNPRFAPGTGNDSLVIRILRSILAKLSRKGF